MTEDEAKRRCAAAQVARLATVGAQGRPHIVPICFALDGETLYSAVDAKPKSTTSLRRLQNAAAHPHVAVLVDHYDDDWSTLWWVRIDGRARIATGDEREHALALLRDKYEQYRRQPPPGPVLAIEALAWRSWASAEFS